MANQSVVLDGQSVGSVGQYAAHPPVYCPDCGSKLYRIFNANTEWKFVCLNENKLVAPGTDNQPVPVSIQ